MIVKEIMVKDVISTKDTDTVFDACVKYRDKKVGCLLVTDNDGDCVGIVNGFSLVLPERTEVIVMGSMLSGGNDDKLVIDISRIKDMEKDVFVENGDEIGNKMLELIQKIFNKMGEVISFSKE